MSNCCRPLARMAHSFRISACVRSCPNTAGAYASCSAAIMSSAATRRSLPSLIIDNRLCEYEHVGSLDKVAAFKTLKRRVDLLARQPMHFKLPPVRMMFVDRRQEPVKILRIKPGDVAGLGLPKFTDRW